MPPILTAQDQLCWNQRIRKEEGVNIKVNPNGFSVRAAIRSTDVPERFKPGHVDPSSLAAEENLRLTGPIGREVRSCLVQATVPPRGRQMFPETCAQDHGFYQKDPAHGRENGKLSTIAGALPKAGIGWKPLTETAANDANAKQSHRATASTSTIVSPLATGLHSSQKSKHAYMKRSRSHGAEAGHRHSSLSRLAQNPGRVKILGHPSLPGGSTLAFAGINAAQPATDSWHRAPKTEEPRAEGSSEGLEEAMQRSRNFMNRQPKYKWYRPLGNSDVSQFCDAYTKCWGRQLYARPSA